MIEGNRLQLPALAMGSGQWLDDHHSGLPEQVTSDPESARDCQILLKTIQQQAEQAAAINRIVHAMRSTLVLDEVLQMTVDQLHSALQVNRCLIFRPDPLQRMLAHHVSEATLEGESLLGINCNFYSHYHPVLSQGGTVALAGVGSELPDLLQQSACICQIQAILIVPLIYQQTYLGGISLHQNTERFWTTEEIAFVEAIGSHCAIAIHQAELYQQLQQELMTRQQSEAALQRIQNDLEIRVEERTAQLRKLNQQLQAEIAERQRTEVQNALLAKALEYAGDAIEITDAAGHFLYTNPAFEAMTGYGSQEVLGKTAADLQPTRQEDESFYQSVAQKLRMGQVWQGDYRSRRKDGVLYHQEATISPIQSAEGTITHYIAVKRDITERKRVEESLRLMQFAIDCAADAAFWTGVGGQFFYVNQAACESLGYSRQELLFMSMTDIEVSLSCTAWESRWQSLKQTRSQTFETDFQTKEGECFPVEVLLHYLEFNGQEYGFAFVRDIRMRKQAEDQLKASLQEKSVMLKEIHHRVKNNLQVICSLLRLQAASIHDPRVLDLFQESQNRVRAMALIHEKLYQSEDLARSDFGEYLHQLARSLYGSYGNYQKLADQPPGVTLETEIEDIRLSIDSAIPCGLIVNELVSNALKHAFPQQSGILQVSLKSTENGYQLRVKDNGIGLPADLDFRQTRSLGLQLVLMLTEQLRGSIALEQDQGCCFTITFADFCQI